MGMLGRIATVCALASFLYVGCGGGGDDGGTSSSGSGGTGASSGSGNGGSGGGISVGGDGGGATDGSSSGGSSGDACTSTIVGGSLVPANLLFVLDRSGSMNCNLPSDGQTTQSCEITPAPINPSLPTKWELTRDALKQAIDNLQAAGNVSAGLVMFPRPSTDCGVTQTPDVPLKPLDAQQDTDLKSFLDTVAPKGNTPLAGATILGYADLLDLLAQGSITGNVFVVLLTDGYETCAPAELDKLLSSDVPTALSINIRTFVIGVPGSENGRALLSQIAWNGGTATSSTCTHAATPANAGDCHFDMTTSQSFSQDLTNALAQISGTVVSCEIDVPTPPAGKKIDFNSVSVQINGSNVPKDDSKPCAGGADGWQLSTDQTKIYLCGTACDDAKKPNAKIQLDLGCLGVIK